MERMNLLKRIFYITFIVSGISGLMLHSLLPCSSTRSRLMMATPNKPEKSTYFDRVIADFIGKRYGAGEGFYGKRLSAMSEEEYAEQFGQNIKQQDFEAIEMTENAVLVVGGEEDIAQWIVFDLAEKGFNVRVATTNRKRAVFVFGLPGFNVDITELKGAPEELYARAVAGTQAIIFCGNFRPVIDFGPLKKDAEDEVAMSLKIMDIAVRARMANVGNIKKIVVLSRYLPPNLLVKRGPITMLSDGDIYKAFRRTHNEFENIVKSSNYDYAIVRAPHYVQTARSGSKHALSLLESDYQDVLGLPRDTQAVLQRVDEVRATAAILRIGALDLAEVVVQSLLQEIVTGISFAVFETEPVRVGSTEPGSASEASGTAGQGQPRPKSDRVRRKAYYAILDADEEQLRLSYMMKPAEAYREQIEEDERVEEYWNSRFKALKRDRE